MALTLKKVHPVEAEAFDFDNGVGGLGCRFGGVGIDEERSSRARAILDIWRKLESDHLGIVCWKEGAYQLLAFSLP